MAEMNYRSPRSAAVIIEQLQEKGVLRKRTNGNWQFIDLEEGTNRAAQTVDIPLIGAVACGMPMLAEENIEALIPVSIKLATPPHTYFFLRAQGDSMDEIGIAPGSMVLVRQQATAHNGDLVVALVDDEATLKEYHKYDDAIVLKPRSSNKRHQPIILTNDFRIQGIVIKTIPNM